MKIRLIPLFISMGLLFGLIPALAAPAPAIGNFEFDVGAPLGDGSLKMTVTIIVNGRPVPKKIDVTNIKKFVLPPPIANEPPTEYRKRLHEAKGVGSQAKAQTIADAINKAFEKEFKMLGEKAEKVIRNHSEIVAPNLTHIATYGSVIIPSVLESRDGPVQWHENKVLGEGGNGGRFLQRSGSSSGARGSIAPLDPADVQVASGYDVLGDPSLVEFGIQDLFVAQLTPSNGRSNVDVLQDLESLLDQNGVPATFDSSLSELSLDNPILAGQTLVWGSTDPGFDFLVSIEGLDLFAVPDTISAGVTVLTLAALLASARRTRRSRNGPRFE